jgi:dTDP-4-amino-4,6-dideoxygalactose transaminase
VKFRQFEKPWPRPTKKEIEIVADVLRSGKLNYWTGMQGKLFEKEFANYVGVKYAIAVANGTLALELAIRVWGLESEDEVIVPSRTYVATASAVKVTGSKPVFADVDVESGNICPDTIEQVRTEKTKAIIVVHLGGWPCDMFSIMEYAERHNLIVIEDCAQAHGAGIDGKKVGSFGHAAAFSFCQDKIMTTCGEGGMVLFQNRDKWLRAWAFKDHGKNFDTVYDGTPTSGFRWLVESIGSNYRLTEVQSAVGRYQLKKLDEWVSIRQGHARMLEKVLSEFSCVRLAVPPREAYHARYKYYAYVNPFKLKSDYSRDRIIEELNSKGVPCFHGSCSEIYLEKVFEGSTSMPTKRLPVARALGETSLVFLVDPSLSKFDMDYVCKVVKSVFLKASQKS